MSGRGWIGVDFDGTLATYSSGQYPALGDPIPLMVERVRRWLAQGIEVRILTARAADRRSVPAVRAWCLTHLGRDLEVTDRKDFDMIELWDDRAIGVLCNTGRRADGGES